MSFLDTLREQKLKLTHTETVVTTVLGDVLKEDFRASGEVRVERLVEKAPGFVIDVKPDLQVASIVPGLYMGSQDVTQDYNLLTEYNLTNILSVGIQVPEIFNSSVNYTFVEALDIPEFDMADVFQRTYSVINNVIKNRKENIYVHCNAGVSRSAAIVIAYLIKSRGIPFEEAYNFVKLCRNVIKPNEGFCKQLELYANSVLYN